MRHNMLNDRVGRHLHVGIRDAISVLMGAPALPTYSYFVGYTAAEAQVAPHVDREQCEVTALLCLESSSAFPLSLDRRVRDSQQPDEPMEFRNGSWWAPTPP